LTRCHPDADIPPENAGGGSTRLGLVARTRCRRVKPRRDRGAVCDAATGAAAGTFWQGLIAFPFAIKIKIEIMVTEAKLPGAVEAIARTARTGQIGDGNIFIAELENAIRIRTEEVGEHAI
jgi:nitrogen regulatory protein PII